MSKEQLKELKYWKMNLNETLVLNGHEISEELKEKTRKYRDLLAYAIEQAERVQELEEKLKDRDSAISTGIHVSNLMKKQNKRYREYLGRLQRATKRYPAEDMAYVVNKITSEALEGRGMSEERLEEIINMLIKDYGFEEASATRIAYDIKDILEESE